METVTNDRLREILHEPDRERAAMARELLAHRERNHRVAAAVLHGDPRAIYREYAKQWMPKHESRVP